MTQEADQVSQRAEIARKGCSTVTKADTAPARSHAATAGPLVLRRDQHKEDQSWVGTKRTNQCPGLQHGCIEASKLASSKLTGQAALGETSPLKATACFRSGTPHGGQGMSSKSCRRFKFKWGPLFLSGCCRPPCQTLIAMVAQRLLCDAAWCVIQHPWLCGMHAVPASSTLYIA